MEGITFLIVIVGVVWGIINIILFFKIWNMTDDIKVIKQMFISSKLTNEEIKVGDIVFHILANQLFEVTEVSDDDGICVCKTIFKNNPRSISYRKSHLRVFKA